MNENLLKVFSSYCNAEIENLKNNELYIKLQNLVNKLKYNLVCEYGKELDNAKSNDLYLSITVFNDKNEMIEIFDEGFLTASTKLVEVDKKERCKFFSWKDEEFIEELNSIIQELEKIITKNIMLNITNNH
ncbi:MAG: hypothetical protein SOY80_02490 [Bacilli bacterium]|nr:hypothetical protein [Bacilli bacterium]